MRDQWRRLSLNRRFWEYKLYMLEICVNTECVNLIPIFKWLVFLTISQTIK